MQLKHQAYSQSIFQIRKTPSTLVSDEKEINEIFTQFYTTLYNSEAPSDTTFMYNFLDNFFSLE